MFISNISMLFVAKFRNKFINKLAWTSSAVLSVSGAGLQSNVSLFIAAER